jgi:hypothetical protein
MNMGLPNAAHAAGAAQTLLAIAGYPQPDRSSSRPGPTCPGLAA